MNNPTIRTIIYILSVMALLYALLFVIVTTFSSPLESITATEIINDEADVSTIGSEDVGAQANAAADTTSGSGFMQTLASQTGNSSMDALFSDAYQSFQSQEWGSASTQLEKIRLADPAYQANEVQGLLARSYFNAGKTIVADPNGGTNRFQLAQSLFAQASTVEPENQEVQSAANALTTYLAGDGDLQVGNLNQAMITFQSLYADSPDYFRTQVGERLYDVYIAIGDQAMNNSNTEIAVDYFRRAQSLNEVSDKSTAIARLQGLKQVRTTPASRVAAATPVPPPPTAPPPTATYVPVAIPTATMVYVPPPPPPPTFAPPPTATYVPVEPTAAPAVAASCPDARSLITSPRNGETVNGLVAINGTATDDRFKYYKIEFGPAERPNLSFLSSQETQVSSNSLLAWNSAEVPDGEYRIRLTVVRVDGNYSSPCEISVTVKNQ